MKVHDFEKVEDRYAGRLERYVSEWSKIKVDSWVLSVIKGYKIPFHSVPLSIEGTEFYL